VMDALPVRASGKIDPKDLPKEITLEVTQDYVAPQTPGEIALAEIWGEVLRVESGRISTDADFFELGGDSLLAMQLTTRVRVAFGVDVALSELFTSPTLQGFAQRIAAAGQSRITRIE